MKKKVLSGIKETVETIVIALVLAFLIRTFIMGTFWIPTGSMIPYLDINDRIMAYKLLYNINWVKRGDIIVFKYPLNPKKDFVKRTIGLPGDVVKIREKKVFINGEELKEPYAYHSDNWEVGFPRDDYGPIKVPPGSLFMMGDNRDSSDDSRFWGFVPKKNIVGEAFFVYWPPWRIKIIRNPFRESIA